MDLINLIEKTPFIKEWQQQIAADAQRQLITGLAGSAKTLAIASAYQKFQRPTVIVTANLYYANQLAEDLRQVMEEVYIFPVDEVLSAEMAFASPEAKAERVQTLHAIAANQPGIYVLPVAAVRKFLPDLATWQSVQLDWHLGDEIDLAALPQQLVLMGYERQKMIGKPGEFSIRGSIIDIYPLNTEYPVRIELFDIEIDSLRYFDVETQRSVENLDEVLILPTTELVFSADNLHQGSERLQELLTKRLSVTVEPTDKMFLSDYFGQLIASWEEGIPGETANCYTDLLYQNKQTILDYFSKDTLLFVDDYARIMETNRVIEL